MRPEPAVSTAGFFFATDDLERSYMMGGILRAPKAPPPPPPADDPEVEERARRLERIERRRRGRAGTIETSDRGLLSRPSAAPAKSLFGE